MSPQLLHTLERLAAANINLLPADIGSYFALERGGFCALVERTENGFGRIGSAGLLTESGFAALIWRDAQPFFVGKKYERGAAHQEVTALRTFQADLAAALDVT